MFCKIVGNKCYCEFQNGSGQKSGILCKRNGSFQKALLCGLDPENPQICSGPSTKEYAVNATTALCKSGKNETSIYKGNDHL